MRFADKLVPRITIAATMLLLFVIVASVFTLQAVYINDIYKQSEKLSPELYDEYFNTIKSSNGKLSASVEARVREIFHSFYEPPTYGQTAMRVGGILIFYGMIAAVIAALMARRLVRPLELISQQARLAASGDLTARAGPKLKGRKRGEIGRVVSEFDAFVEAVEKNDSTWRDTNAAIAHELRTPITILLGRLHAVEEGLLPPTATEINRLLNQTRLLGQIVSDIDLISSRASHGLELNVAPVHLHDIVRQALETFRDRAEMSSVQFVFALDPVVVEGDALRLLQAIQNLLDNALCYGAGGGIVEVNCHEDAEVVRVQILDRGTGLPEANSARLFEHFVRGEGACLSKSGGSGLGLAVVKAIVKSHCGTVRGWNRPDGGAGFELTFPKVWDWTIAHSSRGL
jgi:two-component system, OmpR family, sensor histidine kinase BaeS